VEGAISKARFAFFGDTFSPQNSLLFFAYLNEKECRARFNYLRSSWDGIQGILYKAVGQNRDYAVQP
jgi:hypothetical protein